MCRAPDLSARHVAVAVVALAGCGRVDFDALGAPAEDARLADSTSTIDAAISNATYAGVFAAKTWSGASTTIAVTAHAAGNAVLLQTGCANSNTITPSVTAPGWTFTSLGAVLYDGGQSAQSFVAVAPDTTPTTLTITWSGACSGGGVEADELANTDPAGGATTFDAHAEMMGTGTCTASLTTGHDHDALWAACSSASFVQAVDPAYIKGADDTGGDWSEYRLSTDPAGTVETATFANGSLPFLMTMVSVKPR